MRTLKTLERLIKSTSIPYTELLTRVYNGGLVVNKYGDAIVDVTDERNRNMRLYFENKEYLCLIATEYNYPK